MAVPELVLDLVERFRRNESAYRSGLYNETQVRREFIDPLFECLGWDVNNHRGYAEAYKDVVHEDSLDVEGAKRAPDYCFRIGGTRKFFLEAKKPSVNIREDISPAYQLRRYAWTAKLPLSILTDFEEFAVYDGRVKPAPTDKSSSARVLFLPYREYPDRWDEVAATFSHEAVLQGAFDRFCETNKGKRGTTTVDAAFLAEIESWRNELARNIALRNPQLDQRGLNDAVQRTIDRIIFLRLCEDRGIEDYGRLQKCSEEKGIYDALKSLFVQADHRYNSGLFHFEPERGRTHTDQVSLDLAIDDKVLKPILRTLYYPESPYEFSVMPPDILGQVYEQFLGKVIRLTPSHQAKVEEKPEVRKAGGVYYTPTYIVDYIVQHTVGALLEGRKPRDVDGSKKDAPPLRVADIACGSGSFLIVAYQYLLDWYRDQYVAAGAEKQCSGKTPRLRQLRENEYVLTIPERKRILLDHIYGVDIDTQAVEVTKLSLLLKVIEGENEATLGQNRLLFQERALPDLDKNIKCGNSLIGPDFFANQQEFEGLTANYGSSAKNNTQDEEVIRSLSLKFDTEELLRVNPFDWHTEFPFLPSDGGFDAVIGNPPYVRQEGLVAYKDYFAAQYAVYQGTADLYVYFFERAHQLLKSGGLFGMICSNKFMRANYGKTLRNYLTEKVALQQIIDFGELPVFQNAATFPAIFITQNSVSNSQQFLYAPIKRLTFTSLEEEVDKVKTSLDERSVHGDNWTLARAEEIAILEKMKAVGIPLGEYLTEKIYWGIKTGLNAAFVLNEEERDKIIQADPKANALIKPFVVGDDIRKYHINSQNRYLLLIPKGWTNSNKGNCRSAWEWLKANYPSVAEHLQPYESKASRRCDKGEYWWELRTCDYYNQFENPKIIYPEIAKESRFTLDDSGLYTNNKAFFIPERNLYLLGFLNSRLCWFYLKRLCSVLGDADKGGRLELRAVHIKQLRVHPIDFSNTSEKSTHDQIVTLVNQMLTLNQQHSVATTEHERTLLERQITATDHQIDQLVYALYGLTEEDIALVEGEG